MSKRHRKTKERREEYRKPDDYFAAGPIEFARFGRTIHTRSRANQEQWDEANQRMAAELPRVVAEIDAKITSIAARVASLPPAELLLRAWWEFAAITLQLGGRDASDFAQGTAMRMIDYVQSIVAAVPPILPYAEEVSDEDWHGLTADVQSLFMQLSVEYQMCLTAYRRQQDPNLDLDLEEIRFRATTLWMNVRGKRYQLHERQALLDTLSPHSDVFVRLFGIDATALVEEFDKVLSKLTRGLGDAFHDMDQVRQEVLRRVEDDTLTTGQSDPDELMRRAFEDPELAASMRRSMANLFGHDLFDVELNTNLPRALVDELTWSPGEETDFFAPGEFRGWPLRIWPTMQRPFIRLDGRVLCFDMFALFDNLYRVLQRVVFRLAPDYKDLWNERQQAVSEELPFTYLGRLLPGAVVHRPVYYRWKAGDGPAQWHEADGLVIYADHLFILEIKAGAFTYTSPATDLPAHLASLRNLVLNPARQAGRFLSYLESAHEVAIFDAEHHEVGRVRRSDFRHVTACAVTLDAFTELAARAQHLRKVGIDVGQGAVWAFSLDDLRAYADLFDNPLTFLHFVEQRVRAAQSDAVDLDDELDHLGLYLAQNNYAQHAEEMKKSSGAKISFHGYRAAIDEYYAALVNGEAPGLPRQQMPTRIAEIIGFLSKLDRPDRSKLASFLLDAAGDQREAIARGIDQHLSDNRSLGRARPLSSYGEHAFTLVTWSPAVPRDETLAIKHTQAIMAGTREAARLLIELECNDADEIVDVHAAEVTLNGLADAELASFRAGAARIGVNRVAAARAQGKIGRNEPCPCASGRKYKHCHGR